MSAQSRPRSVDAIIGALADLQHGAVARWQLIARGVSRDQIAIADQGRQTASDPPRRLPGRPRSHGATRLRGRRSPRLPRQGDDQPSQRRQAPGAPPLAAKSSLLGDHTSRRLRSSRPDRAQGDARALRHHLDREAQDHHRGPHDPRLRSDPGARRGLAPRGDVRRRSRSSPSQPTSGSRWSATPESQASPPHKAPHDTSPRTEARARAEAPEARPRLRPSRARGQRLPPGQGTRPDLARTEDRGRGGQLHIPLGRANVG